MKKLVAVIVGLGAMMALMAGPAAANPQEKVTICHAAGLEGTTQYVTLTLAYPAVYGEAGHFFENGTPRAGHEQDYLGPCDEEPPPPPPELVQVCDPETGDIIVVPEDEADQYLPVDDPACDDEPPPPDKGVKVCDPKTGKIIRVDADMADQYLPVNDPACKDRPTPPPCAGGSCTPDPPPPPKCEEGHVSGDQNKACDSLPFTGAHWFEQDSFKVGMGSLFGLAAIASGLFLRRRGSGI